MLAEVLGCCTTLIELTFFLGDPNNIYFDFKKVLSDDIKVKNKKKWGNNHGFQVHLLTDYVCSQLLQGMREDSIRRNFGIMNGFFMSLNDDCGDQPENMLHSQDPWLDSSSPSVTKVC